MISLNLLGSLTETTALSREWISSVLFPRLFSLLLSCPRTDQVVWSHFPERKRRLTRCVQLFSDTLRLLRLVCVFYKECRQELLDRFVATLPKRTRFKEEASYFTFLALLERLLLVEEQVRCDLRQGRTESEGPITEYRPGPLLSVRIRPAPSRNPVLSSTKRPGAAQGSKGRQDPSPRRSARALSGR